MSQFYNSVKFNKKCGNYSMINIQKHHYFLSYVCYILSFLFFHVILSFFLFSAALFSYCRLPTYPSLPFFVSFWDDVLMFSSALLQSLIRSATLFSLSPGAFFYVECTLSLFKFSLSFFSLSHLMFVFPRSIFMSPLSFFLPLSF